MPVVNAPSPYPSDPSSLSNPDEFNLTHLDWRAIVDFDRQIISATATYDVQYRADAADAVLKLDTSHLSIREVHVDDAPAKYSLGELNSHKSHLGQCLSIPISSKASGVEARKAKVAITYETTSKCTGVQWLPPSQTSEKKFPYMFTQCQAIHARSLLPCMDCPGVKMTYDCRVTVPNWATCVMSALPKDNDGNATKETSTTKTFSFHQPIPTPAYLFALATGRLSSHDISPRCRIWSEPTMIDAAAYEFAQTEEFLQIAEELVGMKYVWGRYDLLCLPPSFPYGGMENPCLTFVTPTLLAGDRSLADVVAHEIMHSWSGNLVTNANWSHFWLNEGWTRWLQRKVMMKIKKDDRYFDFDGIGGWKDLVDSMEEMPEEYTRLVPPLGDNDPDDAFSRVPYEKGFCLLFALEKVVGVDRFGDFTRAYFEKFKFGTVTSEQFREFYEGYFRDVPEAQTFDWETWLHQPGMLPHQKPDFDRSLAKESEKLASEWIAYDKNDSIETDAPDKTPATDISNWTTLSITCFLDELLIHTSTRDKPLNVSTIQSMKRTYGFDSSHNAEILYRFCRLAIESGDESIIPIAVQFITSQGRMKYIRPLYRSLFASKMGKDIAVSTFLANKESYHPIAAKMVATDLRAAYLSGNDIGGKENSDTMTSCSGSYSRNILLVSLLAVSVAAVAFSRVNRKAK